MELKSSENTGQKIDPDLVSKIRRGQATTQVINREMLKFYLKAGSEAGIVVKKIAKEGEKFPDSNCLEARTGIVRESMVVGKGNVAVFIESPKGSKEDHAPFWNKLKSLEQEKA